MSFALLIRQRETTSDGARPVTHIPQPVGAGFCEGRRLARQRWLYRIAPLAGGAVAAAVLGMQEREAESLRALHAHTAESRSA